MKLEDIKVIIEHRAVNNVIKEKDIKEFCVEDSKEYQQLLDSFDKDGFTVDENDEEDDFNVESVKDEDIEDLDYDEEKISKINVSNTAKVYINEISRFPLLTAEEEKELGFKIIEGQKANEKVEASNDNENGIFTDEEFENLKHIVEVGEMAKEKMINHNLRLCIAIAKNYIARSITLPFMDLVQEGNMGLIKAVERFDPNMNCKFSTYAIWWIRQSITRAIADQGRMIRLPNHMVEKLARYIRTEKQMTLEIGRTPTSLELANALNTTEEDVDRIMGYSAIPVSLDTKIGEDEDASVVDFVEDNRVSANPESSTIYEDLKDVIDRSLSGFSEKEKDIIVNRFGLRGRPKMTLEELGERYNITRERVRQLESKVIMKLKNSSYAKILREFYEGGYYGNK